MHKFLWVISVYALIIINPNFIFSNCISGNCVNGKGTFLFDNGSKYSGNFLLKRPNGNGILRHSDGSVYEGDFQNGKKMGNGKLSFASGDTYFGNFDEGVISGMGSINYRNGDNYVGEWLNGKASGKGKYTFKDGDIYEGEFIDGQFCGFGKLLRKDGSYYAGSWSRSKKHGKGISSVNGRKVIHYYEMNQIIKVEPFYSHTNQDIDHTNKVQKQTERLNDCTSRYCHLENGLYKYGDGSVFVGPFIDGQGEGYGECSYSNGDRYTGEWKNHAPHGKGTMLFKSGNTYSAIWDQGKPKQKLGSSLVSNSTTTKPNIISNHKAAGETRIFALIVGVATYNHMPSLKYTDDDAYQLYAFLKSPEGGAIPDEQIKIMIDDGATNKTISKELNYIAGMADVNDVIILYMSGHGIDGAYIPSDFDGYKNQLAYDDILSVLNTSKAKHKLFIADACHSGSMLASARTPLNISLENFYSAYNATAGGTAILMSSKKEEVSLEYGGLRQGVFSHFLIKGLKGTADNNHDKLITISELHNYISEQVKTYTGHNQNPSISGDYDKNMPVAIIR